MERGAPPESPAPARASDPEIKKYWVGFNLVTGVGPVTFRRLLECFGSAEAAWHADWRALAAAGMERKSLEALAQARRQGRMEAEWARLQSLGIEVVTWEDAAYPRHLRHIYDPPPVLYVKGAFAPDDEWAVAVVGTRRATVYGREATERIVGELAASRVTIVSGLARGIDSQAHRAALAAGGRTIAVLGSGLDILYPPENAKLAEAIVERGAVVSEFPLGTPPEPGNFPYRNRVISGLSLGVLVVEAPEGSGALRTAYHALEQGRDVFAVPGNIFSRASLGTNKLIQEGAKLVLSTQDILEELNLTMVPQQLEMRELLPENEAEAVLLRLLSSEPMHIDELGRSSGLPIAQVSSTLAMLELKGQVRQVGGMHFVLARAPARR